MSKSPATTKKAASATTKTKRSKRKRSPTKKLAEAVKKSNVMNQSTPKKPRHCRRCEDRPLIKECKHGKAGNDKWSSNSIQTPNDPFIAGNPGADLALPPLPDVSPS